MKFPGEVDECHPEIFNSIPANLGPPKDGQLSAENLRRFFDEGFIIVDSFFKDGELESVKATIDGLVDDLANRLYKAGKIKDLHKDCNFSNRLTKLENDFPGASVILHKIGSIPDSFKKLWSNEKLLNLAEQILGTSNIGGHPVWNLRTKVPDTNSAVVPWHQDAAYLNTDSYKVFQLTAWIPLIDSNFKNGCMQVVRNGHRSGKVARHTGCWKDTWYLMLDEKEIEQTLGCNMEADTVTCEVPYGGLLLISNLIPHRSVPNVSAEIRWSLDMRWQDASQPNGFYGLKESVLMRTSGDKHFEINWNDFDAVNRHEKQDEDCNRVEDKDEFDVTITGPWMKQWELVNRNKHTRPLEDLQGSFRFNPSDLIVG